MDEIIDLDRRISRAINEGRGIRLNDEEVDILVSVGAVEVLKVAAAAALKEQAERRRREREEIRTLTESGNREDLRLAGELAHQRVQELLRSKPRVPRGALRSKRKS